MKVALLTWFKDDWVSPLLLRCEGVEWVTLPAGATGLAEVPNPFSLPVGDPDIVLLERSWYDWLLREHPARAEAVLAKLERLGLVGLDGGDDFQLGFPPKIVSRLRLLLKPQGVYRDRELYNYRLGAWHGTAASWTDRRRPRSDRYTAEDLEKVRLSVPCLLTDLPAFRRAARIRQGTPLPARVSRGIAEFAAWQVVARVPTRRHRDVHCLVTLTHAQRIDALRILAGIDGTQGIVSIRSYVAGSDGRDIRREAEPFMRPGLSRIRFMSDVLAHRVVVAPTGYGELGQRHGVALHAGAALVCQSLDHVETMFPFRSGVNVVYCRPDLSDLRRVTENLLHDEERRGHIAAAGRREYRRWASKWRDHLDQGVVATLQEASR